MREIGAEINSAILKGKKICLRVYALLEPAELTLESIIAGILRQYNRLDLQGAICTSVKELVINGTKANFKRILFAEENIGTGSDDVRLENGMKLFRKKLNEKFIYEYARKGQAAGLYVDVIFRHNPASLIVEVINNSPITDREDKRIRSKFAKSMRFDDIAQFYLEAGDSTEGAGMGIVLVTMLLKSSSIDPHGFTIRTDYQQRTIAKLEIPLMNEHITARDRFLQRI